MRIVFFTHTFTPDYTGGAEVSLYHTCRGLQRRGAECVVLAVSNQRRDHRDEWYEVDGIPVRRITFHSGDTRIQRRPRLEVFDWRVLRAVRGALRELRADLFHVHNVAHASLAPFTAARLTRTPVICTLHDHWLLCPNNMLYQADSSICDPSRHSDTCAQCARGFEYWGAVKNRRKWFARLTRPVARFVSPSQALIDLHVAGGYSRERFRLVPNALAAPDLAATDHARVLAITAAAAARPTLVFSGGGVLIKGAQVVLDAVPDLLAAIPNVQIVVAGGGEPALLEAFKRYAPAVRVVGRIPFNAMHALFAAADLTLLPSVWPENSPMTIYENYQVGTPVVASRIGGIPELIEHGNTGYLVPPNDPAALVEQVVAHTQRPAHERRRMRQACVQRVRTQYTLDQHLDALLAVYAEVIGPAAARLARAPLDRPAEAPAKTPIEAVA